MKKKKLVIALAVVLAAAILATSIFVGSAVYNAGCMFGAMSKLTDRVNITATIASSTVNMSKTVTLDTSFGNIVRMNRDNYYVADADTAMFAFLMCLDAQSICRVNVEGENNTDDTDNSSFPASLGFEGTRTFYVGADATTNQDDTVTMVVSWVNYDGGCDYNYFFNISFQGTTTVREWNSCFDIGCDSSALYLGDTTDWTDKENHKGFDVAATRALRAFVEFAKTLPGLSTDSSGIGITANINGYSRGAAVANIFATYFDKAVRSNLCPWVGYECYTFATPATTTKSTAASAQFIYNYINTDDLIPCIPTETMGFVRYGQDIEFSLGSVGNELLLEEYAQIAGTPYNASGIATFVGHLNNICFDRYDYYRTVNADTTVSRVTTYSSEESRQRTIDETMLLFSSVCSENQSMYYKFDTFEEGGQYKLKMTVAPAFIGRILPYAIGGGEVANSGVNVVTLGMAIMNVSRYSAMIWSVVGLSKANMSAMHLPAPYLVFVKSLCE